MEAKRSKYGGHQTTTGENTTINICKGLRVVITPQDGGTSLIYPERGSNLINFADEHGLEWTVFGIVCETEDVDDILEKLSTWVVPGKQARH